MVDVCKTLSIDYMASCPARRFARCRKASSTTGQNKSPEWLTCMHEEVSVGMAHGYAKVAGKPMAAHRARHGRHAACGHGDLQCLLRPGADSSGVHRQCRTAR
ncbi:MAG: hypothetical protein WDN50_25445 [Bradyrhizobium sp.]